MNRHPARHITILALSLPIATWLGASVTGQATRPTATMDDLLAEVRALRNDVAKASGASMRLQALTARVSVQEQRLKAHAERLARGKRELDEAVAQRTEQERRLAILEAEPEGEPEFLRNAAAAEMGRLQRDLGAARAREERLRLSVSELSSYLATEEGRWVELNQRLDDIDRSLAPLPR